MQVFKTLWQLQGIIFIIAISLTTPLKANATSFSIECLGLKEVACADLISDIVTPKFTQKFLSDHYQITLLAIQTKNGITASHASVAPILKTTKGFSAIGTRAWVVTDLAQDDSIDSLLKIKLKTCREAIRNMMEYCESTSNCDLYNSQ